MCGFRESRVSSFIPRKVGVSTCGSVLSPSLWQFLFFGGGEGENCGLSLHFTDLKIPKTLPCSQIPRFCKKKMWWIQMHSTQRDHLHAGCWRHVEEALS